MVTELKIPARDVRVDDQLYMGEAFARNPNMRWANVRKVRTARGGSGPVIVIRAGSRDNYFAPDQIVTIHRIDYS